MGANLMGESVGEVRPLGLLLDLSETVALVIPIVLSALLKAFPPDGAPLLLD
jgi:hypothetical protein